MFYTDISNSLIIQYGQKLDFQQGTEITLPITFPTYYIVVSGRGHYQIGTLYYHSIVKNSYSSFSFQNGGSGGGNCLLEWIAIGY